MIHNMNFMLKPKKSKNPKSNLAHFGLKSKKPPIVCDRYDKTCSLPFLQDK